MISFIFKEDKNYNYEKLYKKLKEKGYIIDRENFLENHIVKIGLVGNIEPEEIENFLKTLEKIILFYFFLKIKDFFYFIKKN